MEFISGTGPLGESQPSPLALQFRLPDDYPAPREILSQHFPKYAHHFFFKGGWGYDIEHATQIFETDEELSPGERLDGVSVEEVFIDRRIREELTFARAEDDQYALYQYQQGSQQLVEQAGRPYDVLDVMVEAFKKQDLDQLAAAWKEHNAYKDDPEGKARHWQLHEKKVIRFNEIFYFDISGFLLNEFR